MSELPKFVRDAMGRQPIGEHPDADLLTAYQENALTAAERQRVTEHLAVCNECREIVFLAQPYEEPSQTMLAPQKTSRFSWRLFAATAAVVVVVGSAILLERGKQNVASPSAAPMVATETKPALPRAEPEAVDKVTTQQTAQQREPAESDKLESPKSPIVASRSLDNKSVAQAPAPTPPPPRSAPRDQADLLGEHQQARSAGATAADTQLSAQAAPQDGVVGGLVASPPTNRPEANYASRNVTELKDNAAPAKAKKSEEKQAEALPTFGAVAGAVPRTRALAKASSASQWHVSKTGALERQTDTGVWTSVLADKGVAFHAVAALGDTIWAGADHGALYVSRDAGAQWQQTKIGTEGAIVGIRFDDENHGTVRTSQGETWTTADAGATWTRK